MKKKEWLKILLSGIGIGIGSAIPGVSGGTIAVICNVYEKIINAVSNIFKKFTESFLILLPILVGLLIGLIPTIILVDKCLEQFLFGLICIFAGFIIGSLPKITSEIKNTKPTKKHFFTLVITFIIVVLLGVGSVLAKTDMTSQFNKPDWWFYIALIPVGLVASIALVVPGVSGGMILVLLGFYAPLIESTVGVAKDCLNGNWSMFGQQIGLLLCFLLGVIIGFIVVSKIMSKLLSKYHDLTFFGILGFIVGSLISLYINNEIWSYYKMWSNGGQGYLKMNIEIPIGIVLLIMCSILSYLLIRISNKKELEKK